MPPFKDLTGQKFGRLTVLGRASNGNNGGVRFECRCDCGNATVVFAGHLRKGNIRSCGCLHDESASERMKALHAANPGNNFRNGRLDKTKPISCTMLHKKIAQLRGKASEYACCHCDDPANDWALIGEEDSDLFEGAQRYALDVWRYAPLCRYCHVILDTHTRLGLDSARVRRIERLARAHIARVKPKGKQLVYPWQVVRKTSSKGRTDINPSRGTSGTRKSLRIAQRATTKGSGSKKVSA